MYTAVIILILIVCALLAVVVLVQNSKGGGLAANFSAPNQIMGVRKTTETIEKITWWLFGILVVLCIAATMLIPRPDNDATTTNVTSVAKGTNATPAPATAPMATDIPDATEE